MSGVLALYTTVYPGAERFLPAWYQSVCAQTDRDFDIWIGADQVEARLVADAIGKGFNARSFIAPERGTPATVRQNAIDAILSSEKDYPAIVFVDCDDLLYPHRVEAARNLLQNSDISGCAMDIVEENGSFTGLSFHPPALSEIPQMLARANIFGLSNTTYRTDMLRRLPPAPAQCRLMDWFMATAAWAQGASFSFEKTPQMQYRQYGQNTARILPPFTADDICRATALVVEHYKHVLAYIPEIPTATRTALEAEQARVQRFADRIVQSLERIERYVTGINQLPATHIWWDYVAHPSLESQWKD